MSLKKNPTNRNKKKYKYTLLLVTFQVFDLQDVFWIEPQKYLGEIFKCTTLQTKAYFFESLQIESLCNVVCER